MDDKHTDNYEYMHSCYIKGQQHDAVVVATKNQQGDRKLDIIKDPKITFYVTKKGLRTHQYKKEYAPMHELDKIQCRYFDLGPAISKALYGYVGRTTNPIRLYGNSPYVYGADLKIESLVKAKYRETRGYGHVTPTVGGLDIEQSLITDEEEIIIMSHGYDDIIYCGVYAPFMKNGEKQLRLTVKKEIDKYIDQFRGICPDQDIDRAKVSKNDMAKLRTLDYLTSLKYEVLIFERELDLIQWQFLKIHDGKPDFLNIWNMGYDIPTIVKRLERHGVDPAEVFCHPDIPKSMWSFGYKLDRPQKTHWTHKWDWVTAPGYTQYIDAMCLYSLLRKVAGQEPSYTLDYIVNKNLDLGKMTIGMNGLGHKVLQRDYFDEYVAYNIIDSALLIAMEMKNTDVQNALGILGPNHFSVFNKQTTILKHNFYFHCLANNCVPASVSGNIEQEWDKIMGALGGAVLDPTKTRGAFIDIMEE
jgi:hypothetical protein